MYNKQQLEAINSLDGRIRVIAGAGAGKTSVITERYIKLLDKRGEDIAQNIFDVD